MVPCHKLSYISLFNFYFEKKTYLNQHLFYATLLASKFHNFKSFNIQTFQYFFHMNYSYQIKYLYLTNSLFKYVSPVIIIQHAMFFLDLFSLIIIFLLVPIILCLIFYFIRFRFLVLKLLFHLLSIPDIVLFLLL